jgi:hypothetical protein
MVKQVHVPTIQKVQKTVKVPQIQYEDQIVEVPVQKQVNVPMIEKVSGQTFWLALFHDPM